MSKVILTPEQQIRQRYAWFEEAERLGNVRLACTRLGISRKTFYKWRKRFQIDQGAKTALLDRSRPPHRPRRTVGKALRRRLLALRQRTHLGPARLRQLLRAAGGASPARPRSRRSSNTPASPGGGGPSPSATAEPSSSPGPGTSSSST
jgi:transposase-like protein